MDYKKAKIDDIIEWCKANGKVDWLKKKVATKVPYKVYPKVEVNGKMVADKSQPYSTEMRDISFIQLKYDLFKEFMPDQLPKAKDKNPTFIERINSL